MKGFRLPHFLMIAGVAVAAVAVTKTVGLRSNIPGVTTLAKVL